MVLNTWSPAGGTDFEGWGNLGSLGGGSGSLGLGVSLEVLYLAHFLPVSCFLFHHDLRELHPSAAMELPATKHFPPWLTVSTQTESRNKPFSALGCFLPRTWLYQQEKKPRQSMAVVGRGLASYWKWCLTLKKEMHEKNHQDAWFKRARKAQNKDVHPPRLQEEQREKANSETLGCLMVMFAFL